MKLSFEEQLQNASILLQQNDVKSSIEHYLHALEMATGIDQKIHLNNILGKLYQKTQDPVKSLEHFKRSLKLYEDNPEQVNSVDRASIFNNVAAIYSETDIKKAIENYKYSLDIFQKTIDSGKDEYNPHLANTQFVLADVYAREKDFYQAKKYYKAAINLYGKLDQDPYRQLKANAHYQLGNIYTEEFNLYDAKTHYDKALKLYNSFTSKDNISIKPFLAATLNNLAVTYKSMDEIDKALEYYHKALHTYEELSQYSFEAFAPYLAETLNSMGIVYSEKNEFKTAIDKLKQSVELYNELANSRPQDYTHYLAKGLHNLGLFYFELKEIELAMKYFKQALTIRKKLAEEQPVNFGPDYCATALNLVELYQFEIQYELNISYKSDALALLKDVKERLQLYDDQRPVVKNMISDCHSYLDYFSSIDVEQLTQNWVLLRIDDLSEEIDSTILPKEKIEFQIKIVEILKAKSKEFPKNERFKKELAAALNNLSWLYLRLDQIDTAIQTIGKAQLLKQAVRSLKCNLGHALLLRGNYEEAKEQYLAYLNEVMAQDHFARQTIARDIQVLKNDGVVHEGFDRIAGELKL